MPEEAKSQWGITSETGNLSDDVSDLILINLVDNYQGFVYFKRQMSFSMSR